VGSNPTLSAISRNYRTIFGGLGGKCKESRASNCVQ
jgi:hypothetical protein